MPQMTRLARRTASRARTLAGNTATGLESRARGIGGRRVPGLLSIIVPMYNVEEYLDECLTSLRVQKYRRIEIVVVDDGSPDRSIDIARRHRLKDPRVRIVRRENGGLSAARNTGVETARGEFLAFVDSDDTVTLGGYTTALRMLGASGSDFAVMRYQRIRGERITPAAPWIRDAHAATRMAITLGDFPTILCNSMSCSKIFRRRFWDDAGLRFVEGIIYEDQQLTAEAYSRAGAFDIVSSTLYNWRFRRDGTSITQSRRENDAAVRSLNSQIDSIEATQEILRRLAGQDIAENRAIQALSNDLPQFTSRIPFADEEYWEVMRRRLPEIIDLVPREMYAEHVVVQQKLINSYVLSGDRERALWAIEGGVAELAPIRVTRLASGVHAEYPGWETRAADGVDDTVFRLPLSQTRVRAGVRWRRHVEPGVLRLSGWAFIENVDLADLEHTVRVRATSLEHEPVEFPARPVRAEWIDEVSARGSYHCDYRNGGLEVDVDLRRLPVGTWQLQVEVEAGGIRRTGDLAAGRQTSAVVPFTAWAGDDRAALLRHRRDRAMRLTVVQPGAVVRRMRTPDEVDGPIEIDTVGPAAAEVVMIRRKDRTVLAAEVVSAEPGQATLAFRLPPPARTPRAGATDGWRFGLRVDDKLVPAPYAPDPSSPAPAGTVALEIGISDWRSAAVRVWYGAAVVTGAATSESGLTVQLRVAGLDHRQFVPQLVAAYETVPGEWTGTEADPEADLEVRFEWQRRGVDGRLRPLPPASYRMELRRVLDAVPTGEVISCRLADEVADRFPIDELLGDIRVVLSSANEGVIHLFGVRVKPPLLPDERGNRNQLLLRQVAVDGKGSDHSVFFRTLYGEVTNDSARELHHELRRRGTTRTLVWAVADRSVPVPDGGVGVLEESRAWHETLGDAGHVVLNIHQPNWYVKPAPQVMVETFHGYPYKRMGQDHWRGLDLRAAQVASYLRRSAEWDYLVSPSSYATPLLLREFFSEEAAAKVSVIEAGYPRNDMLLDDQRDEVRAATRELLGLPEGANVVLYGPTFRDVLSVDGMTARAADYLRPGRFVELMGPDTYLLMRGHAFNARGRTRRVLGNRVIDVTHYPDVMELVLASDAGILDYSSLRFDYALTRKPMVFLVPDKQEYHRWRPGLLDYDSTAPGPHVATTEEAAAALRDPQALVRRWSPAVEEFIGRYLEQEDGHASARVIDAIFGPGEA